MRQQSKDKSVSVILAMSNTTSKYKPALLAVILFTVYSFTGNTSAEKREISVTGPVISAGFTDYLSRTDPLQKKLIWVYFKDKKHSRSTSLTERSLHRRELRVSSGRIVDETDLQVCSEYLGEVSAAGAIIRNRSRWFNSVSCLADNFQIAEISRMSFVKSIEPVIRYKHSETIAEDSSIPGETFQYDGPNGLNYGPSLNQSNLINIPPGHDAGFTGDGILIASFDSGFDNLQHVCFNRIRSKGLRTYDFVNGDTIVANGSGRMGNGAHGTITLSLVAGYDPGFLVSPAFNATYLLAKTENTESETPLEEDNWLAAAEWADSLGADIITSSLGYLNFDPPYSSYTWESMNGTTALITRAADMAVSKGIVVVTSAGNSGFNSTRNTLNAPADAFNAITVGAITTSRNRASFSSVGPTIDGRIKPEIMALGVNNYTARFGEGGAGYLNSSSGTSLACPMVSGVCAMILSADKNLSPIQVKSILMNTASNSTSPNNLVGYGVVDAWSAIQLAFVTGSNNPSDFVLSQNFPNPFNPSTTFRFALRKAAEVSLILTDLRGRKIATIVDNRVYTAGVRDIRINFASYGLSSGVYFYSLIVNGEMVDTKKMALLK